MSGPETSTVDITSSPTPVSWALGDTRLARRPPPIDAPTLLFRVERNRPVPPSHARRLAENPGATRTIAGAAHLAGPGRPDEVARAVLDWTN